MASLVCTECGGVGVISIAGHGNAMKPSKSKTIRTSHNAEPEIGTACASCGGTGILRTHQPQ